MVKVAQFLVCGTFALHAFWSRTLPAQEPKVGDQVVPIHDTDLRDREKVVDVAYAGSQHRVIEIGKDGLRLDGRFHDGWLRRTEIVPSPEAIAYFADRITHNPQDWEALRARGRLLMDDQKLDEAVADFNAAIKLNPKDGRSWQSRGIARMIQKKFDEAVNDFSSWQELQPVDLSPRQFRSYARLGKAGLARTTITPSTVETHLSYPDEDFKPLPKGEAESLLADLSAVIEKTPSDTQNLSARALAYVLQKDFDKAIVDLSECVDRDGKWVYFYLRGRVWTEKEEYVRALKDFDEASRLSPDGENEEIYRFRGWTRLETEDLDGAIADFTKAISIEPQDIVALGNRGVAFLGKGEFRKAIADADRAIKIDKSFAAAWFIRGQAWTGLGELKLAVADLDEYVRLDPKESGYAFRGAVHHELGQRAKAIADLREAVRVNPSGSASQASLACLLAASDEATKIDREEAISLARVACLRTEWKSGECLQILAIVYAELAQFEEAVNWQTAAVELATERDVAAKRKQTLEGFKAKRTCRQSLFTLK